MFAKGHLMKMTTVTDIVPREHIQTVRTIWPPGASGSPVADTESCLLPWGAGEHGQQTFLKLARADEEALLCAGVAGAMEADVQRLLMKMTNEGWELQGEVQVIFDGEASEQMEAMFGPEVCLLELGSALLPLVDPFQQAPLLSKFRDLRRDLARDLGVVAPGVQVRDDLTLDPSEYRLRLRDVPVARGQLFLDRFLAVGSLEQLGGLNGWTTTEPTYRLPAKWIEPSEREKAETAGCMLLGALSVLVTHLRDVLRLNSSQLLGLQETHSLLMRLRKTHPIVVEEFLASISRVRKVRHVLQGLLAEAVPIRDLITILEVLGDQLDELGDTDSAVERVRGALAREILNRLADDEGIVRGLVLSDEAERHVQEDTDLGREALPLPEAADGLTKAVREALEVHREASALFTPPRLRRTVRRRLARALPTLAVVSVADIVAGCRVEIAGTVQWSTSSASVPRSDAAAPEREAPPRTEGARPGLWKPRKRT